LDTLRNIPPSSHTNDLARIKHLDPTTRVRVASISRLIDDVKDDAKRIIQVSRQELEEVANRYARAPSEFLAGVVGGAIGSAGGVAISISILGGGVLVLTGPLGLAVGAALGILAFRGPNQWRLERATQKTSRALSLIKAEINSLPHDSKYPDFENSLYEARAEIIRRYTNVAIKSIDDTYIK
jgi:hypothetical protein